MSVPYYDCCGNCTSYDNGEEYCEYYRTYCKPTETCRHQENKLEYGDSSCYITTVVCNILGYSDKCEVLQILRNFRDNVMQKDDKYKELLFEYDTIGPEIAKCLNDNFSKHSDIEMIEGLYEHSIKPISELIVNKEYDLAVNKYVKMTNILATFCGVERKQIMPNNYDYENGGHGKLLIKE